jgi:uncharacterized membrane protein YpjA
MATSDIIDSVRRGTGLPERPSLPRYVAPLPAWVENLGLRLAVAVAAVNLVGTAFGFWYYGFHPVPLSTPLFPEGWQFAAEPVVMWPFVPDSPVATFFIASSLLLWTTGRSSEVVNALAFFGCIKLGAWTPFVLLTFSEGFLSVTPLPMYVFLVTSHLAMVLEAFLIYRYAEFRIGAVFVAAAWYGLNDVVDYFLPIVGRPHHTLLPAQVLDETTGFYTHPSPTHEVAAAGAVVLTLTATFLALATRAKKLELELELERTGAED